MVGQAAARATLICQKCGTGIRFYERHCPACSADCGFPNVRAAQERDEQEALAARLRHAESASAARGSQVILSRFRDAIRSSSAVVCCSVSRAKARIDGENRSEGLRGVFIGAQRCCNCP
jgi:hypothetical protein